MSSARFFPSLTLFPKIRSFLLSISRSYTSSFSQYSYIAKILIQLLYASLRWFPFDLFSFGFPLSFVPPPILAKLYAFNNSPAFFSLRLMFHFGPSQKDSLSNFFSSWTARLRLLWPLFFFLSSLCYPVLRL